MRKSFYQLLLYCSTCYSPISGQTYKEISFKIDKKAHNKPMLLGLDNKDLAYIYRDKETITINYIDSVLNIIWSNNYITNSSEILSYSSDKEFIYLLLSDKQDFQVIRVSKKNKSGNIINVPFPTTITLFDFIPIKNKILIAGKSRNNPIVYAKDYVTNTLVALPNINQIDGTINVLQDMRTRERILVVMVEKKTNNIYVNEYTYDLKLDNNFLIENDYKLLEIKICTLNNKNLFLLGNYSSKSSEQSQGIFTIEIKKDKSIEEKFYDFSLFGNFYKYLSTKKEAKIQRNIEKRKEKGKKFYSKTHATLHELLITDNTINLSMDLYNIITKRANDFGTPSDQNQARIYVEYKFSHAFSCVFSREGTILWHNIYDLDNEIKQDDNTISHTLSKEDTTIFFNVESNNIIYQKKYKDNYDITSKKDTLDISISYFDKRRNSRGFDISRWYDTNFIYSGRIKHDNNNLFFIIALKF